MRARRAPREDGGDERARQARFLDPRLPPIALRGRSDHGRVGYVDQVVPPPRARSARSALRIRSYLDDEFALTLVPIDVVREVLPWRERILVAAPSRRVGRSEGAASWHRPKRSSRRSAVTSWSFTATPSASPSARARSWRCWAAAGAPALPRALGGRARDARLCEQRRSASRPAVLPALAPRGQDCGLLVCAFLLEVPERDRLQLARALARDAQLLSDLVERPRIRRGAELLCGWLRRRVAAFHAGGSSLSRSAHVRRTKPRAHPRLPLRPRPDVRARPGLRARRRGRCRQVERAHGDLEAARRPTPRQPARTSPPRSDGGLVLEGTAASGRSRFGAWTAAGPSGPGLRRRWCSCRRPHAAARFWRARRPRAARRACWRRRRRTTALRGRAGARPRRRPGGVLRRGRLRPRPADRGARALPAAAGAAVPVPAPAEFAAAGNQVLYSTHSPAFLDVGPPRGAGARGVGAEHGTTIVHPAPLPADESFRALSELDAERSELCSHGRRSWSRAAPRRLVFPLVFAALGHDADRHGISIVECGGKPNIPLFARICDAVGVPTWSSTTAMPRAAGSRSRRARRQRGIARAGGPSGRSSWSPTSRRSPGSRVTATSPRGRGAASHWSSGRSRNRSRTRSAASCDSALRPPTEAASSGPTPRSSVRLRAGGPSASSASTRSAPPAC